MEVKYSIVLGKQPKIWADGGPDRHLSLCIMSECTLYTDRILQHCSASCAAQPDYMQLHTVLKHQNQLPFKLPSFTVQLAKCTLHTAHALRTQRIVQHCSGTGCATQPDYLQLQATLHRPRQTQLLLKVINIRCAEDVLTFNLFIHLLRL